MHYNKDFGLECRIGRFHNIYGPHGTWKGAYWLGLGLGLGLGVIWRGRGVIWRERGG